MPARPAGATARLLPLVLAAALLGAAPALGQSLLSQPPARWPLPAWARSAGGGDEAAQPGVYRLVRMVEQGRMEEAYPHLETLYAEGPPDDTSFGPAYRRLLRRRIAIALLQAGAGAAPPAEQERRARAFVEERPDDAFFPYAFFYLNQALARQDKPLEESFFFDRRALEALPGWMQTRYLLLQAGHARREGRYADAARYRLQELTWPDTLHRTERGDVMDLLRRVRRPEALERLMERFADLAWLQEQQRLLRAITRANAGRLQEAYLALERIEREGGALSATQLKWLREARESIERTVHTRPDRIGVLLPLGSSISALRELARETLDGLRMRVQRRDGAPTALERLGDLTNRDLEAPREPAEAAEAPRRYELVIRDTRNHPPRAARLVEELVREEQVVAILGPIASDESAAAMERAESIGVPIVTLSITAELPPNPRFAFRHNKSHEAEVRDLVRYAMDYLHLRDFAVLYPEHNYGRTMRDLFWEEVTRRGGRVVGASGYLPWSLEQEARMAAGLEGIFRQLTGVDRHLQDGERRFLEYLGADDPEPEVQFDALFVPVPAGGSQDLRLIAPYPATVNAEHATMLGSRNWNSEAVLVAGAGKLDGAVFVDVYHQQSNRPRQREFRRSHRHRFQHRQDYQPPSFYTALGYDTLDLLIGLLDEPAHRTRERLAEALVDMEPYTGLTGLTSFLDDGRTVKEAVVLRLQGLEIVPAMEDGARP